MYQTIYGHLSGLSDIASKDSIETCYLGDKAKTLKQKNTANLKRNFLCGFSAVLSVKEAMVLI